MYFLGRVFGKIRQKELALALWDTNRDGRTWECIYFLRDGKQIAVPFNPEILGYKDNYIPQGTLLLREEQSEALTEYILSYEVSIIEEDQISPSTSEETGLIDEIDLPFDQALEKILQIAQSIGSKPVGERIKLAKYLARNPKYSRLVKQKSKYVCEIYGVQPFIQKNGMPYAEAHHLDELAVARLDNPLRMICVCPTCHRIIHYGNDASLASRHS
ncbi:hypothetical protein ACFLYF_06270 [Chloroflexota bacterium]